MYIMYESEEFTRSIADIFYAYDPIGINFGSNPDEYTFEAQKVIDKLNLSDSVEDVRNTVYNVMRDMFDTQLAGDKESQMYKDIAKETWKLWNEQWTKIG